MAYYEGRLNFDTNVDDRGLRSGLSKLSSLAKKSAVAIGAGIAAGLGAAIKSGVGFESAFAGVEKTVDATELQLASLRKEILQMSNAIPLAASSIAGIATAAGQLGIKTENISDFTRTMADLGVATNMTSEQAATNLARLANITQMPQENFDRLGSTVVDLGNNLATTEAEIVDMALRLAGTGNQVGMTEAQILAFSGALSSVGIQAEAGGTAFSKLMSDMQLAAATGNEDLKNFAAVAGMSAQQFKQAFEQDASQAIISFIQGLSRAQDSGVSAIQVLDDMGISEIRMRDSLLRAAGASGVFAEALEIGNSAWESNTALTKEAEKRYDTVESKLMLLKNGLANMGIAIYEGIQAPFKSAITTATEQIGALTASIQGGELQGAVANIGHLFGNLVTIISNLASAVLPIIIQSLSWLGENINIVASAAAALLIALKGYAIIQTIVTWVAGLSNAIKGATAVLNAYTAACATNANVSQLLTKTMTIFQLAVGVLTGKVSLATAATTAWSAALKFLTSSTGLGLIITLVGSLTAGIAVYNATSDNASDSTKNLSKELDAMAESYENAKKSAEESTQSELAKLKVVSDTIPRLEELANKTDRTAEENREYHSIVDGLNRAMPELKLAIDNETGALNMQIGVVWRAVEAYQALARAKALENLTVEAETNKAKAQKAYEDIKTADQNESNPVRKITRLILSPEVGETSPEAVKAKQQVERWTKESDYYGSQWKELSQQASAALADVNAAREWTSGASSSGGGYTYTGGTSSGGGKSPSSAASKAAKEAEEARQEQVESYKKGVDQELDAEQRKFDILKRRGQVSKKDYLANVVYRAECYRGYADDVLKQDYMTTEEQEEIRKEWLDKAEDLETEYLAAYVEMDKAALDKQKKNGTISQKEYWEGLGKIRDQYFVEGSEEWLKYSDEILDMQKDAITKAYTEIAKEAEASLQEIEKAQKSLEEKLKGFGNIFEQNVIKRAGENGQDITFTSLHDFEKDNKALIAYQEALDQLREKGKTVLGDDFPEFFQQFGEMSVEEGTNAVRALLSASEEDFNSALSGWQEYQRNSEKFAENFYKDDWESLKEKTMAELREAFDDVPDTFLENGELAADAFGDGFIGRIQKVFDDISSAISREMAAMTPQLSVVGGIPIANSTTYNTTYQFASSGETVAQQLQTIDAQETRNRLRGK